MVLLRMILFKGTKYSGVYLNSLGLTKFRNGGIETYMMGPSTGLLTAACRRAEAHRHEQTSLGVPGNSSRKTTADKTIGCKKKPLKNAVSQQPSGGEETWSLEGMSHKAGNLGGPQRYVHYTAFVIHQNRKQERMG